MLKPILYSAILTTVLAFSLKTEQRIDAYQISQILPDISMDGRVDRYDTSTVEVFYFKDLVLYKLMYIHTYTDNGVVKVKDEKRIHYILFKPNEPYGFDFDEHKTPYKRRIKVDSAFSGEWSKRTDLFPMFIYYVPTLLTSKRSSDSLIETYRMRDKADSIDVVECNVKFTTSISNIELSICKELDSIKNMKVYEFSFVGNPEYLKRRGIISGKYYSYYHLQRLESFDREFIRNLFDSYN